jgi:hypothetical protein
VTATGGAGPAPALLLAEADRLLAGQVRHSRGRWPRACALLIRVALEAALRRHWASASAYAGAAAAPMRAQLLILRAERPDVARQVAEAWHGLSRATHHHAYELAPTAAELRAWHDLVLSLVPALTAPVASGLSDGTPTVSHSMSELPDERNG